MAEREFNIKTYAGILLGLLAALGVLGSAAVVYGADNIHTWHRRYESMTYHYLSSVPSAWHDNIDEAALSWTERTAVSITHDPNSADWIHYDALPDPPCDPDTQLACTNPALSGDHIVYVDIYYNENDSFGESTFNCNLDFPDVQETAAHEFGHAAGWLKHEGADQGDVMAAGSWPGCYRIPTSHDIESMDTQYANHTSGS